jgi:RNA polymerase sigma-70 factor, ECF subfamily
MTVNANVTRLLKDAQNGDESALNELFPLIYDELRKLASVRMNSERANHTLQPTALVHEVYMRLIDQHSVDWQNRLHFFGLASEMMRRVLVNHAVAKKTDKRGGEFVHLELDEAVSFASENEIDFVELDDALNELERFAPRQAKVVEMRFFGGLTIEEVASVMNLDERTIKRDWRTAKAWLFEKLKAN